MPGNRFPDFRIIALRMGIVVLFVALYAILAGSGRNMLAAGGGKQQGAGCKRCAENNQPDKGFACHGSLVLNISQYRYYPGRD